MVEQRCHFSASPHVLLYCLLLALHTFGLASTAFEHEGFPVSSCGPHHRLVHVRVEALHAEAGSHLDDNLKVHGDGRMGDKSKLLDWDHVIATPDSLGGRRKASESTRLLTDIDLIRSELSADIQELKSALGFQDRWHYIVHYREHGAVEHAETTANASAVLLKDSEGGRWFIMYMSRGDADMLNKDARYQLLEPMPARYKIDPYRLGRRIKALDEGQSSPQTNDSVALRATLAELAVTHKEAMALAHDWQSDLQSVVGGVNKLECRAEDHTAIVCEPIFDSFLKVAAEWMSQQAIVQLVEIRARFKICNKYAKMAIQSVSGTSTPVFSMGLRGEGQVIGVADTGLDVNHCFFVDTNRPTPFDKIDPEARKVVQYVTYGDNQDSGAGGGHGTHVCGSAAGSPTLETENSGMAPAAKIAFFDLSKGSREELQPPISLSEQLFPAAYKAGARIMSNSWGSDVVGYGADAVDVDKYLYRNPDVLLVFAAGNEGDLANGSLTISSPGNSKNALTVGASLNTADSFAAYRKDAVWSEEFDVSTVAEFSSQGPTTDGRIKPDILAPGMFVYSANGKGRSSSSSRDCDVTALQGTSVATPLVAGAAALVRQYFMDGFYPSGTPRLEDAFIPSGALLKAMIIHSAAPMKLAARPGQRYRTLGAPPDNIQGFGRIVLENVLFFSPALPGQPRVLYVRSGKSDGSVIPHGIAHLYTLNVTASTELLRVTLVWMDPPTSANTLKPVINDVNVRLLGPNRTVAYPNNLNGPDRINNVEVIAIRRPAVGVWTVSVEGTSICCKGQAYALVITGSLAQSQPAFSTTATPSTPNTNAGRPTRQQTTPMLTILSILWAIITMYFAH